MKNLDFGAKIALFLFLKNSPKIRKSFNLKNFGVKRKLRLDSNIYLFYFGHFWSYKVAQSVLVRKVRFFCKGGWFWRSRMFQISKITSPIDAAPQNYYMDRSKSTLEQKNFQLLKKFYAFLFLRQVTATFQNGQNWKFFLPKCSPGFNELGGIGFQAVFVITNPPEAFKFEKLAILTFFMDFF